MWKQIESHYSGLTTEEGWSRQSLLTRKARDEAMEEVTCAASMCTICSAEIGATACRASQYRSIALVILRPFCAV